MSVVDLYDQHVRELSTEEQLELVALIARKMATAVHAASSAGPSKRSLLELEGLGADIWQGVDAQTYVNDLRDEWAGRP